MDPAWPRSSTRSRALAEGGKRLRPAFAYWGWRGARDAAGRRGRGRRAARGRRPGVRARQRPGARRRHGRRAHPPRPPGHPHRLRRPAHRRRTSTATASCFGTGAAILVGDLALVWSDELLRCSGLSAAALTRARAVWDTMRTEVTAGQYLDLLRAAGGLPGPDGALTVARYKSAGYTVQRPLQLGAAIAGAGPRGRRGVHRDRAAAGRGVPAARRRPRACSATRPSPASPPTTTCARASRPC